MSDPLDEEIKLNISPEIRNRIILEQREFEHKNLYSCCLKNHRTDKRILEFIARSTISLMLLIFSFTMIAIDDSPPCSNNMPFYSGLISLIAGYYINQSVKQKK